MPVAVLSSINFPLSTVQRSNGSEILLLEDVKDLIYHSSDMEISEIQDNPQVPYTSPIIMASELPCSMRYENLFI